MQKKNRKGFTLIELLAVIVILAIIALIVVPVIMNVIIKARVSAFEDSAYGIVKAGEMYYTNKLLEAEGMTGDQEFTVNGDVFQNVANSAETLELSGSIPNSGKITVTSEGKVALAISNGEYCIRKATAESKVKAEKLSDLEGACDYKTIFTKASDSTSVPTCITNKTECSVGTKVGVQVNARQKYDFYVIEDNTSENKVTLLMSENLGETVRWGDVDSITVLDYLQEQTSSWTNIPLETYTLTEEEGIYPPMTRTARARLITYTEANTLLSLSDNSWVYGNLSSSSAPYGYWTSSKSNEEGGCAMKVGSDGSINAYRIGSSDYFGIRPVIIVSKTIL